MKKEILDSIKRGNRVKINDNGEYYFWDDMKHLVGFYHNIGDDIWDDEYMTEEAFLMF